MIENRKLFIVSCLFFLAFIIFNFPFPHAKPYGELEAAGSFKIALSGDEYGIIHINKEIDVADLNNQIETGGGNGITVTIQSEGKMRKL